MNAFFFIEVQVWTPISVSSHKRPSNTFSTQGITLSWNVSILYHVHDTKKWPPGHHQASCCPYQVNKITRHKTSNPGTMNKHVIAYLHWNSSQMSLSKMNGTLRNSKRFISLSHNEGNFVMPLLSMLSPSAKDRTSQDSEKAWSWGQASLYSWWTRWLKAKGVGHRTSGLTMWAGPPLNPSDWRISRQPAVAFVHATCMHTHTLWATQLHGLVKI